VHALCAIDAVDRIRTVMLAETGSLGVRGAALHRWPQQRTSAVVHVDGHPIAVKVTELSAGVRRVKVEHDDAVAAAAALHLPLRVVMDRAQASAAATLD
jgi:pyridinium-3,5-bisthiocarboxylic acid mononucleotide nickel chelatase